MRQARKKKSGNKIGRGNNNDLIQKRMRHWSNSKTLRMLIIWRQCAIIACWIPDWCAVCNVHYSTQSIALKTNHSFGLFSLWLWTSEIETLWVGYGNCIAKQKPRSIQSKHWLETITESIDENRIHFRRDKSNAEKRKETKTQSVVRI